MKEPRQYVDFLGIKMPVATDEEITAEAEAGDLIIYAVIRVADADPHGGSPQLLARRRQVACERCDHMCWLDPLGYAPTQGKGVIICIPCLPDYYAEQKAAGRDA